MVTLHRCYFQRTRANASRLSDSLIIGILLIQLIVFDFASNTKIPNILPTASVSVDNSGFTRTFIRGLEETDYFRITAQLKSTKESDSMSTENTITIHCKYSARFHKKTNSWYAYSNFN